MARCPACGETLSASAAPDDLCQVCHATLETGVDTDSSVAGALSDQKPIKPRVIITYIIIAINVLIFLAIDVMYKSWSAPDFVTLVRWGADWGPLSLHYQWWRMLTSTFLHLGLLHLADNMLILWILGIRAERVFGKFLFLFLYLSSGVAASIVQLAVTSEVVICGASGAIFGLLGGLVGAYLLGKVSLSTQAKWGYGLVSALMILALDSGANDPEVANSAHVAGLVFGLVFGVLVLSRHADARQFRRWVISGAVALLLLTAASVQLLRGHVAPLAAAVKALDEGQPNVALLYVNAVLQKEPNNSVANAFAAQCYVNKHDYKSAEASARKALAADANNGDAALLLGKILTCAGHVEEARGLRFRWSWKTGIRGQRLRSS